MSGLRLPRDNVPEHDCSVLTRAGEDPAVRAECHCVDLVPMAPEDHSLCPRSRVPQANGLVGRRRGKPSPVVGKDQLTDPACMTVKFGEELACVCITNPDG